MTEIQSRPVFPRTLRPKELDLLEFVLPPDRTGYKEYREHIAGMVVLGEGRRGPGNLVLGYEGDRPDVTSPLAPVIAYGMVVTTRGRFSVTVREYLGRQIDVEIVSSREEEVPDHFEEKRRWTYSSWRPGDPSPSSGKPVREVPIADGTVLAISTEDKRLWVFDAATGIVHLLPITNFYNELMLLKGIRDPGIALRSGLFFEKHASYSDEELRTTFVAYNKLKRRIDIHPVEPRPARRGVTAFLGGIFRRTR